MREVGKGKRERVGLGAEEVMLRQGQVAGFLGCCVAVSPCRSVAVSLFRVAGYVGRQRGGLLTKGEVIKETTVQPSSLGEKWRCQTGSPRVGGVH